MKKVICILLLITNLVYSQNPGFELLKKINGVEVYYKKTKTKEATSKDTWIIEFEYTNNSNGDLFYKTDVVAQSSLEVYLKTEKTIISHFAVINIENTKAISFISDRDIFLRGDKTRLKTDKYENIYILKKGKTYTKSMDFRSDKNVEPVLSIQIINSITFTENIKDFL